MSQVRVSGNASGTGILTVTSPNTNSNRTLTLPDNTGTLLSTASAGTVLQVVQATYSTQVVVSTNTYTDTGLSASITPTSSTSKILVLVQQNVSSTVSSGSTGLGLKLLRGVTDIYNPSPTDSTGPYLFYTSAINLYSMLNLQYLDSPATTSSTTYKTQGRPYSSAVGQNAIFQTTGGVQVGTSSMILMEIAA
jgi:hypothetical protein